MKLEYTGWEIIDGSMISTTHHRHRTLDTRVQATLRQIGGGNDRHENNHLRLFYPLSSRSSHFGNVETLIRRIRKSWQQCGGRTKRQGSSQEYINEPKFRTSLWPSPPSRTATSGAHNYLFTLIQCSWIVCTLQILSEQFPRAPFITLGILVEDIGKRTNTTVAESESKVNGLTVPAQLDPNPGIPMFAPNLKIDGSALVI